MSGSRVVGATIIALLLFCFLFPMIFLPIIRRVNNHIIIPFTVTNITNHEKFIASLDCSYCVPVRMEDVKVCTNMNETFNWSSAYRCRVYGECPKSQECDGGQCCTRRREIVTLVGRKRGECQETILNQSCIAQPRVVQETVVIETSNHNTKYNYTHMFDSWEKYNEFFNVMYNRITFRHVDKTTFAIGDGYYYRTGEIWGFLALVFVCAVIVLCSFCPPRK